MEAAKKKRKEGRQEIFAFLGRESQVLTFGLAWVGTLPDQSLPDPSGQTLPDQSLYVASWLGCLTRTGPRVRVAVCEKERERNSKLVVGAGLGRFIYVFEEFLSQSQCPKRLTENTTHYSGTASKTH